MTVFYILSGINITKCFFFFLEQIFHQISCFDQKRQESLFVDLVCVLYIHFFDFPSRFINKNKEMTVTVTQ